MSGDSTVRIHHGDGLYVSPSSMSEAEWTLIPGIGVRTAQALYAASAEGAFEHSHGDEVELAMLRVPGVGPETIRSAREFVHFGDYGIQGKDTP